MVHWTISFAFGKPFLTYWTIGLGDGAAASGFGAGAAACGCGAFGRSP